MPLIAARKRRGPLWIIRDDSAAYGAASVIGAMSDVVRRALRSSATSGPSSHRHRATERQQMAGRYLETAQGEYRAAPIIRFSTHAHGAASGDGSMTRPTGIIRSKSKA